VNTCILSFLIRHHHMTSTTTTYHHNTHNDIHQDEYFVEGADEGVEIGTSKLPYRQFGTCTTQANCTGGVPWTGLHAMPILANSAAAVPGGAPITSLSNYYALFLCVFLLGGD
jgi:spore maturation protein SpmB